MISRVVVWMSAGIVAAGLSAATLAGAASAIAQDDSAPSDTRTSESSKPTGNEGDSQEAADTVTEPDEPVEAEKDVEEDSAAEDVSVEPDLTEGDEADGNDGADATTEESSAESDDEVATESDEPAVNTSDASADTVRASTVADRTQPVADTEEAEAASSVEPPAAQDPVAAPAPVEATTVATLETESAPAEARLVMTAAEEEQPAAGPSLINIVGTLVWGLLDFVIKLVDLPPVIPANSSVTMGRSQLEIDCGDGYTADADWYYPKEGQPEKFIYFQHGFPARAFVYDVTLRELAERNNAVVLAPSITSNYFACDGCSLTADPMHAAVARLFEGDREALLASARAAGYEGALPEKFVITGQSAGAMLAAGASGYYYASAPADQKDDMVGVLLFDGSAANGALARALDKLPSTVPVLHVAGEPVLINNFGDANKVLLEKRPGQFNGVQLVGGAHSDAFQSSAYFGLVQAIVAIGFGASSAENVEAVQILSQGWLTDMYAGRVFDPATRTGIYGNPGQPGQTVIDIPTDAGMARAYVLPGPVPTPSAIEQFIARLVQSINSNDYVTCSADAAATASCSAADAQTEI